MKKLVLMCALMLASATCYATSGTMAIAAGSERIYLEDDSKITPVSYSIDLGDVTNKSDDEIEQTLENLIGNLISDSDEKCSLRVSATIVKDEVTHKISIKSTGESRIVRQKAKEMAINLLLMATSDNE